jgi:zinc protease
MRKSFIFAFLIVLAALSAFSSSPEEKIFPFQYRKIELENGFKAYLIHAGARGQIAYVTVVRAGSREEVEPGRTGYAHFFEHMMFRGTARHPDFYEIPIGIGAMFNASTSSDFTQYYFVASSDSLEDIIDLESDRFMNLQYSESQFRTEAGAILGEFSQGKSSPFYYLNEKVNDTAFDKHTYKHTVIGFEKDVRNMPEGYGYSVEFYRRYYRPENCVLLLAGDFDFDHAESLIRKYYTSWKSGYRAPDIPKEPPQTVPRNTSVQFSGRTPTILSVDYKGPAWSASDRIAVATKVLGEVAFGENSSLYRKLVLQDRKVQSLAANFNLMRDPGLVGVTAVLADPAALPEVTAEIENTVDTFRRDFCDGKQLEDAKNALRYGFLMRLETAQNVCFALSPIVTFTGGIEAVEDYYRTLSAVTPEDVRSAAERYLDNKGKTVVTLTQVQGEAR